MNKQKPINVLFVCMGNICRSPTAEGVFRDLVVRENLSDYFFIDSAGTHGYHVGHKADERAHDAARRRGVNLGGIRSRQLELGDYDKFDYILAMDKSNYGGLLAQCTGTQKNKCYLLLELSKKLSETEVPDPYYGGDNGFEHVLDLIETASEDLLHYIRQQHHF